MVQNSVKLSLGLDTQFDRLRLSGYQSLVPHGGLLSTNSLQLQSYRYSSNKENKVTLASRLEPAKRALKSAPGKVWGATKSGAGRFNALIMEEKMKPLQELGVPFLSLDKL